MHTGPLRAERPVHTLDDLAKMSAQQLVDIAVVSYEKLNQQEELLLTELCTRIDPTWVDRTLKAADGRCEHGAFKSLCPECSDLK